MGLGGVAVGLAAACAASGDEASRPEPALDSSPEAGVLPPSDSGPARDGKPENELDGGPLCSLDGWCPTTLPGEDITVADVVPFEHRAFALMTGSYIGYKIAEWTPDGGWQYITKKLEFPLYSNQSALWAPTEDEVFFTVNDLSGFLGLTFGAFVVRGRRPVPPETDWSWTTTKIDCDRMMTSAPLFGVNAGDMFVSTCGKIYRSSAGVWEADAGTSPWSEEGYVDPDATHPVELYAATGTGADDLWFGGGRWSPDYSNACATLVHKTAAGYETVIDGVPAGDGCTPIDGIPSVRGLFMNNLHAVAKGRVVGAVSITGTSPPVNQLVKVATDGGQLDVITSRPSNSDGFLGAVWGLSEDDLFVVSSLSTTSTIFRAKAVWGDAPSYTYSRLAINGLPNTSQLHMIRGTSNQNIWAVGNKHAYHKATP
jgi:hypothetical protein